MNREHLEKAMRTLDRISEVMAKDGSLSEDLKNDIQETLLALAEEHLIEEVGDFSMEEVDLETGLDLIIAAFKLADQRSEDRADRVKIHLEIGDTLYNMGRWREAQAYYELASKATEESGHQYDLGKTLQLIGRLTRRQGRWHQARQALNRAVKIFKSLDRTIDEAETLPHIGNIEFEQGAYDQVTRRLHKALKLCKTLDADEMKANVNLSLGAIHQVRGQVARAIKYYNASLIEQVSGSYDLANENFDHSLAHFEHANGHRRLSQVYFNRGVHAKQLQNALDQLGKRVNDTSDAEWKYADSMLLPFCPTKISPLSDLSTCCFTLSRVPPYKLPNWLSDGQNPLR